MAISGSNVSVTGSQVTAANLNGSGGTIAITAGNAAHLGNVTAARNALLDAAVLVEGVLPSAAASSQLPMATLSADTVQHEGALTAIDINVTGDLSISDTRAVPAITATTTGSAKPEGTVSSAIRRATSIRSGFCRFDRHSYIDVWE